MANGGLDGGDLTVVRPRAVQVRPAVHQPGEIECEGVPREDAPEEALPQRLAPQRRQVGGNEAPDEEDHGNVVAPLEHHHRIGLQVVHVDGSAPAGHLGVLPHQQPADVAEEEAAAGVVRIGVRIGEAVVGAVVPTPLVDVVLQGEHVTEGEEDAQAGVRLVGAVAPQSMGAYVCLRLDFS